MEPVTLFELPSLAKGVRIRLLRSVDHKIESTVLFKGVPEDFAFTSFRMVERLEDADFLILPESIRDIDAVTRTYLDKAAELARSLGKEILVFLSGDYAHRIHLPPPFIVFKGTEYRKWIQENEVIYAPFVGHVASEIQTEIRTKNGRPVVSFCGYAGFPSIKSRIRYLLTNTFLDLVSLLSLNRHWQVLKRGVYWRRRALRVLARDSRIDTRFIVRPFFGGNAESVKGDAAVMRREYLENIRDSDFVVTPKGDANFSSRFYETLALGRIPILIDTDMILPLEHVIDYDRFILRIPYTSIDRIGDYVVERYAALSNAEWAEMQELARQAYRDHLRFDSYFNEALPLLRDEGVRGLTRF